MSKTNTWENDLLLLVFNNTDAANIGDAGGLRGSVTAGNLVISLHNADPGEAGTQLTNETNYTGYTRVTVARSGAGFVVTGSTVNPAANIDFPQCTAGSTTITHIGIGTSTSGAGKLLYKGTLTPNIAVSNGVIVRLTTASAITED